MDSSDSDWLLGGEMGMECDLIRAEHKPRSRGFVQGGENVGDWSATHRLASWTSGRLCLEKDSPFDRLDIADTSVLEKSRERQNCGSCNRSRKFFCYSCCCALPSIESSTPRLDLPIRWTNWFERVQGHRFANHYQKLFFQGGGGEASCRGGREEYCSSRSYHCSQFSQDPHLSWHPGVWSWWHHPGLPRQR